MTRWLALLLLLIFTGLARGGLDSIDSYVVPSQDGSRLMVMRCLKNGVPIKGDHNTGAYQLPGGRTVDMNATFPISGVYDVATFQPLWTRDMFHSKGSFCLSRDFMSMAVINLYAVKNRGVALEFFHEGKSVKSYRIGEILKAFTAAPFIEHSTSFGFPYDWVGRFEAEGDLVYLSTASREWTGGYREVYRFDLKTGNMVESKVKGIWIPLSLVLLLVAGMIWWFVRRSRLNPVPQ